LTPLSDLNCGDEFEHDGSRWMKLAPHWTGYDGPDEAMAAGLRAEIDVADGGTVRVWCACLTAGPWHPKGGLRPLWETTKVSPVKR